MSAVAKQLEMFDIPHRYDVILSDPPWRYNSRCQHSDTRFGGGVHAHYPTMSDDEIRALPVRDLAEHDSALFMWVTGPKLDIAFSVIEAWGFQYKTIAFVWIKANRKPVEAIVLDKNGKQLYKAHVIVIEPIEPIEPTTLIELDQFLSKKQPGIFHGTGYFSKANAEICLLATRGNTPFALKPAHDDVSNAVIAPIMLHSQKPPHIHKRIERMYPSAARLEMFARRPANGWSIWGNQVQSDINL